MIVTDSALGLMMLMASMSFLSLVQLWHVRRNTIISALMLGTITILMVYFHAQAWRQAWESGALLTMDLLILSEALIVLIALEGISEKRFKRP